MALFNFKKKNNESKCCCSGKCDENKSSVKSEVSSNIKILGSGCAKCNELEENTKKALEQLNINEGIEHVKDFTEIAKYGVMSTPALVVDGKVIVYGKVLKTSEIVELLNK